ncbi:M3 family oligoendopeptidase [Ornithinibacillus gellani]|uniref:M3 family oligoendopeptidase n=1 Tax=Ornithinibacillus gellani TaxID=2293253 RepID=UPI000F493D7E|nr:M3 family oligoendopeptidase [Ornithinibacillus gellani]TQS74893.1 M3 family oligoendopeptidase [Ornithinibacillus gellani]
MQTFQDYTYERPNLNEVKETFYTLLDHFKQAETAADQTAAMEEINILRNRMSTLSNLVAIRASIDTNDTFYQAERDFFDQLEPELNELVTAYYRALLDSPFRTELEQAWGTQLFDIAEYEIKAFSKEIIPLLQKENKLVSDYGKLVASAQVDFDGDTYTLAQLAPFAQSEDRSIRKKAVEASAGFFEQHSDTFDDIYDQLVKLRHNIAVKLGYKNFVELGYIRMMRVDYDAKMVEAFRKQVRESIVPLATKLFERQANRIDVDTLKYYDESFKFKSGNAKPKGTPEWIIENGLKMYEELSPETNEFFHFMLERNLMDLEAKKGKEAGGYCTFIADYASPFIFSNFNGTSGDIDVLTHEAGHAFQCYQSRNIGIPEYVFPTLESAEIHSMSMEFFTWPWMELFFKEDADKYKFSHLADALLFLPYGVAVDEFQHLIYENPEWTPDDRKQAWKQLENVYLPHRNYDGNPYLESGNLWKRQSHIYGAPFYYIDYTLAQICALQFWTKLQDDHEQAWKDYLHLCGLGGSRSFLELVEAANLQSPFAEGTVDSVLESIETWLDSVDDKQL